jgi:hypothetical protein
MLSEEGGEIRGGKERKKRKGGRGEREKVTPNKTMKNKHVEREWRQ